MFTTTILKNKWLKLLIKGLLIAALLLISFYISIYVGVWGKIPSNEQLESLKQSQATEVLDANSKLVGKFYIYDRQSIRYNDFQNI